MRRSKLRHWEASFLRVVVIENGGGAFDVGLYIAFPIMVVTGLFFALFPFIMGNLDVDSVGPPPTV